MKKLIFTLSTLFCISASLFASTDTITNSGMTFVPANLTINLGDTVLFDLASIHNAVEVSQATWNANGSTSNGGFQVPYGGGIITLSDTGTYYYVCQPHATYGMKGIITVLDTTTTLTPNTIVNAGNQFSPDTLMVMPGDTITFNLASMHNAVEVSQATWNANGTTSNGGFQVPYGGGTITLSTPGTHYYVCQSHAALGMKGIIIVMDTTTGTTANTITNVGDSFDPDTLTVMPGDTITFDLESIHNAVEVSQATWNANGNTPNGGFQVPFGGGQIVLFTPGIHYYVCQPHASIGMKGIIIVMDTTTNIDETASLTNQIKVYPNPAHGILFINGAVPKNSNSLSVAIYASDGRLVKQFPLTVQGGKFSTKLNIESLPAGLYLIGISNQENGISITKKITIK